jgi:diguanylate cyclase (GGDEF)-like protein
METEKEEKRKKQRQPGLCNLKNGESQSFFCFIQNKFFDLRRPCMSANSLNIIFAICFIFFILTIALFPPSATAQRGPHLLFKQLSIEHGLSQNSVNCIIQDRSGFMWFGTETGLNKFDGYTFTIYIPREADSNTLSNSWINALYEDRHGSIWAGTENGLNQFIPGREQFIHYVHNPDDPNTLSSSRIFSIYESKDGNLWIGTDAGLNLFNRSEHRFIRFQHDPALPQSLSHNHIRAICQDREGFIWVGTFGGGLNRLDPGTGQIIHFRHDPANPDNSLSDDYILSLLIDNSGIVWIGTNSGGLVRFNPALNQFKTYRHDPANPLSLSDDSVNCLLLDSDATLWVGTNAGGLNRFDPALEVFVAYQHQPYDTFSLSDNRVVSLYITPARILWVGTYRGISKLNLNQRNFLRFLSNPLDPASLSHPEVRAFWDSNSWVLWVGTDGGGLDAFDRARLRILHFLHDPANPNSLSSNRVFSIVEDRDRSLWIGTYDGGLNHFNPVINRFTHYRHKPGDPASISDDRIRPIFIDRSGSLWIGTDGGGLNRFDPKTKRFKSYRFNPANPRSLSSDRIFSIAEDSTGNLWIGAYGGGLCLFNPEKDEFTRFTHDPLNPSSLSSNYVVNVYVDRSDNVWAGTNGGGLSKFGPATKTFIRYTEANGLPSSVVYGILEDDDGKIWLSSNRGLSRLDPQTGAIKNFDVNDGLQSYEFNGGACHKGRNGWLYFGGINGFNAFHPGEIHENDNIPPVVITDFQISNVSIKPGMTLDGQVVLNRTISQTRALELSWKHRVIAFEFAALDYTCPEKNQYAYILKGFEKEWNHVGTRRFASYSNLPPGEYVFRVRGSNNDGRWNEAGASITIKIIPPFWRTRWFYSLSILLGAFALFALFRYRITQINRRKEELEREVEQRTEELSEANRKLEMLAITDGLTEVANYRRFRDFLEYEWRRATRSQKSLSLLITDLDDFKDYNDTFGHQAGDECLKQIARMMVDACQRPSDLVCRYGGDEFAVVLAETDTVGAYNVAEKIRERVENLVLNGGNDTGLADNHHENPDEGGGGASGASATIRHVTICIGCATMNPAEGGSQDDLIARADRALYKSKSSGKNKTSL